MDFIIENIYLLVLAAAGIAQWWKSTQEAKRERENGESVHEEYDPEEFEEFVREAERRNSRPAVPPPLPTEEPVRRAEPSVDRSPEPFLKQARSATQAKSFVNAPHHQDELARQAALAERLAGLKQAKKARSASKLPDFKHRRSDDARATVTTGLRARLRSRRELRSAFVLKEILEKPVSLR